jgi:hypothetical protein
VKNYTRKCQDPNELVKALWKEYGTIGRYSHYITIQLPRPRRSANFETAKEQWREVMACFEYNLLDRQWYKPQNQLPFIGCATKGNNGCWHCHLLLESRDGIPDAKVMDAMYETWRKQSLTPIQLHIEPVEQTMCDIQTVLAYTGNHIKVVHKTHFDTTKFILSGDLFWKE